ncbi:hypothetical protein [Suicoccus acidiformans]|uniref:hypothetical protein n=1 Tax=Suicoccus acidiformans TaxID=2036206 RepID=UPI000E59B00E
MLTHHKLYFRPLIIKLNVSNFTILLEQITDVRINKNLLISQRILVETPKEHHYFAVSKAKICSITVGLLDC